MSIISEFYNLTADVYRQVIVSGTRTPVDNLVVADVLGVLRPITNVTKLYDTANIGKEFDFWCDSGNDIKTNDYLLIDSEKYGVAGVQFFEDLENAIENHLQVRVIKR